MIEVSSIYKTFGKFEVLKDVIFNAMPGQCIALIGPNGCGKTTLIKTILGMTLADSGNMKFLGKDIGKDHTYRNGIGYMPQKTKFPENMTVEQVINMISDIRGEKFRLDDELIQTYQLESIYSKRIRTLSGGTRQKLGASIAFMFSPSLLILDEPTAGLDPISSEILRKKIIKEIKKDKSTIISSHVLSELDEIATHVIYMQEGRIMFQKSVEELKQMTGEERLTKIITKIVHNKVIHEENI